MIATVTTKGQVTIPKEIRDRLAIRPNDRVHFLVEKGRAVLVPVKSLKDLRAAVSAMPGSNFEKERQAARQGVARRIMEKHGIEDLLSFNRKHRSRPKTVRTRKP